ncbi:MAG: hypothetical protein M0Z75_07930 [Nitrospiraceae bacterium]|nr:hypothetical protein [Nitrospiraceae bacterium]
MHFLRKGLVLKHTGKQGKGVVIDWGITGAKYRKYIPSKKDLADAVRVWTGERIEVWPLAQVFFEDA